MQSSLMRLLSVLSYLPILIFCASCASQPSAPPTAIALLDPPTLPFANAEAATAAPTAGATVVATETAVSTINSIPTALPPTLAPAEACTPNSDWVAYTVKAGDSLNKIATLVNTTVEALLENNCLGSSNLIFAGQTLQIPRPIAPTPTATSEATAAPIALTAVHLSSLVVERDSTIRIWWEAQNASTITLWPLAYDSKTSSWSRIPSDQTYQGIPLINLDAAVGETAVYIQPHAQYPYRFELIANNDAGETAVMTTDIININCHSSIAGLALGCPSPAETTSAYLQQYENGTLLWLDAQQEILLLSTNSDQYVPWTLFPPAVLLDPLPATPDGWLPPAPRFAGLWTKFLSNANELTVGELLGWATQPEQAYEAQMQLHWDNNYNGVSDTALLISLPNGRFVSLLLLEPYAKTGPSWQTVTP